MTYNHRFYILTTLAMIKLSEQVRRLEDSIDSLREENKKLGEGKHKEPRLKYKGNINSYGDLPSEGNEEGDFYTYKIYDKLLDERCTGKWVWYKSRWIDLDRIVETEADERDEIVDHQKWEISKLKEQIKKLTELNEQLTNTSDDGTKLIGQLKSELLARVKQVEDLQSSYKTLQKENERLKAKLEQTVDEYDEDYQTFHNCKNTGKYEDDIEFMNDIKKIILKYF